MESLEKELLELSENWKSTAREMIAKSECGSRSEMVNRMLYACAEMLEWKIKSCAPDFQTIREKPT
jgi:hypothetical protein